MMYPPVAFPPDFPPLPADMTSRRARQYFAWFQTVIPERIAQLESEIRKDPDKGTWKADFTLESLRVLGSWFDSKVATQACEPVPVLLHGKQIASADYKLTGATFSMAFDAGIYFGEILCRQNSKFKWEIVTTGSKRNIDFGHLVIRGVTNVVCKPVRLHVHKAHKAVAGTSRAEDLIGLCEFWVASLSAYLQFKDE